jgi:hypothetical protein
LIAYRRLYERSLQIGADNLSAATIPVEKAQAEIILVAGGDDALWPSDMSAKSIEERLASAGKNATLIHHPNAGHRLLFPRTPALRPRREHLRVMEQAIKHGGDGSSNRRGACPNPRRVGSTSAGRTHASASSAARSRVIDCDDHATAGTGTRTIRSIGRHGATGRRHRTHKRARSRNPSRA